MKRWLLLLLLGVAGAAQAERLPRWEMGMGAGYVSMPDYRGADEGRNYLLPFPYFAYRLDWLKADRNGVRATVFGYENAELNLSLGASPPVRSKRNAAREGMPDVKPMVEFGPSLDFSLWRDAPGKTRLDLRLPLRAVFTASNSPEYAGWVFTPKLNLDFLGIGSSGAGPDHWRAGLVAGPMFASARQNNYFYGVDAQYARGDRPAYTAHGGYAGTQFLGSLSRRYDRLWVGAYARYDRLQGASFEDSPLVRRKHYATWGLAFTWTFARSDEWLEVDED